MNLNQVHRDAVGSTRSIASLSSRVVQPVTERIVVVLGSLLFDNVEMGRETWTAVVLALLPLWAARRDDRLVLRFGESTLLAETLVGVELCQFSSDLVEIELFNLRV